MLRGGDIFENALRNLKIVIWKNDCTTNIKKTNKFDNKTRSPLELRLAKDPNPAAEQNVDTSRIWTEKKIVL